MTGRGPVILPGETDLIFPDRSAWTGPVQPYTVHTYYFGFSIPEAAIGAFIYVRAQPAFALSQGGVVIFRDLDNRYLLDAEHHDYRATMPWPKISGARIVTDNGLSIEWLEPGVHARLSYRNAEAGVDFELDQVAISPLFARGHLLPGEEDFHVQASLAPGGSEQFMRVTGQLQLREERFDVDCFSVRDRSWNQVRTEPPGGARSTPPPGWTPIAFGPDLVFNANSTEAEDTDPAWLGVFASGSGGIVANNAWLVEAGEVRGVRSVHRGVQRYHPDLFAAQEQVVEVVDDRGTAYRFTGEAVAMSLMFAWPNAYFCDSVYRWRDDAGRVGYSQYHEFFHDRYLRARRGRSVAPLPLDERAQHE